MSFSFPFMVSRHEPALNFTVPLPSKDLAGKGYRILGSQLRADAWVL